MCCWLNRSDIKWGERMWVSIDLGVLLENSRVFNSVWVREGVCMLFFLLRILYLYLEDLG